MSFIKSFFTPYEIENECKLPFLDVLLIRNSEDIETTVYRKDTNKDIYMHWNSFAPNTWKRGTLRTLIMRAHIICSNNVFLKTELQHIRDAFHLKNGYPNWVITQIINQVEKEITNKVQMVDPVGDSQNTNSVVETEVKTELLVIPYNGDKGSNTIKALQKDLDRILPNNVNAKIVYTATKLGNKIFIKDQTRFEHNHDVIYSAQCPSPQCNENYIGEVGRRVIERIKDHSGRDRNSHLVKHCIESGHEPITDKDFKIIGRGFRSNSRKRKIAEALLIKRNHPTLNTQEKSVPIKLFS